MLQRRCGHRLAQSSAEAPHASCWSAQKRSAAFSQHAQQGMGAWVHTLVSTQQECVGSPNWQLPG